MLQLSLFDILFCFFVCFVDNKGVAEYLQLSLFSQQVFYFCLVVMFLLHVGILTRIPTSLFLQQAIPASLVPLVRDLEFWLLCTFLALGLSFFFLLLSCLFTW